VLGKNEDAGSEIPIDDSGRGTVRQRGRIGWVRHFSGHAGSAAFAPKDREGALEFAQAEVWTDSSLRYRDPLAKTLAGGSGCAAGKEDRQWDGRQAPPRLNRT
jgi:hypothetical protein